MLTGGRWKPLRDSEIAGQVFDPFSVTESTGVLASALEFSRVDPSSGDEWRRDGGERPWEFTQHGVFGTHGFNHPYFFEVERTHKNYDRLRRRFAAYGYLLGRAGESALDSVF